MTAPEAVPIIVGAAIGAGGAVAAQITVSIFAGRRETKRLNWERERQDLDWQIREAERFLSVRQDLYGQYVDLANRFLSHARQVNRDEEGRDPKEVEWPDVRELRRLRWTIELLGSPLVQDRVGESYTALLTAVDAAERRMPDETREETMGQAQDAWRAVTRAMRADLHGDQELDYFRRPQRPAREVPLAPPPARVGPPWWRVQRWWRRWRRSA
jgi:hypothetical protein